jgi:hypothetical protein
MEGPGWKDLECLIDGLILESYREFSQFSAVCYIFLLHILTPVASNNNDALFLWILWSKGSTSSLRPFCFQVRTGGITQADLGVSVETSRVTTHPQALSLCGLSAMRLVHSATLNNKSISGSLRTF